MDKPLPGPDLADAAWVKIDTRLEARTLFNLCQNIECLFRLNPYLSVEYWTMPTRNRIHAKWINSSNHTELTLQQDIQVTRLQDEIRLCYSSGLKKETRLVVEPQAYGSTLTVIDTYDIETVNGDDECITSQVDKSLPAWGVSLKAFFHHYAYLRKIPGIELAIDRFWIRLSPMARRIVYILLIITAFELLLLFVFVLVMVLH